MIELWIVIFLVFVGVATTMSYAFGFNRGQEQAVNFLLDDMIEKGLLEVIDEGDVVEVIEKDEK